jgi:hypothetical protein
VNRKAAFSLAASDLKVPEPCPENDIGDCKEFWTKVEYEMLVRGLCEGNKNPFSLKPDYTFWASWIGECTRNGNEVMNSE